ncbi:MAG TPA: hypothetical protein VFS96_09025 [Nitrolancea sp.]|nr:hypothetical protein [Nitrolancea sp.]
MTVQEAVNRGLNFFAVAFLAIVGIPSTIHVLQIASGWAQRLDGIALGLIAIAAIGWYLYGQNRYQRSVVPLVFLSLALATQVAALLMQRAAGGPNFGISVFMLLAIIVFGWEFFGTREPQPGPDWRESRAGTRSSDPGS